MTESENSNHRHFSSLEEEFKVHEAHAEDIEDIERKKEIQGVRYKIGSLGLSVNSTRWVDETHGNKRVLGQFNLNNSEISLAGFHVMKGVAQHTGHSTEAVYEMVINHELLHKKIHHAEGAEKVNLLLSQSFDADKVHYIEEGLVSEKTSKGIDAYADNRTQFETAANELGTTREKLSHIIIHGDYKALTEIIGTAENPSVNSKEYQNIQKTA